MHAISVLIWIYFIIQSDIQKSALRLLKWLSGCQYTINGYNLKSKRKDVLLANYFKSNFNYKSAILQEKLVRAGSNSKESYVTFG